MKQGPEFHLFKFEQTLQFIGATSECATGQFDSQIFLKIHTVTNMITEGTKDFLPAYSAWFGKPVVLLVMIRRCHVPMPCRIVGESAADVRVRIKPGWELEVRKELILAVEEDAVATDTRVN
jgi:hypothetical protein